MEWFKEIALRWDKYSAMMEVPGELIDNTHAMISTQNFLLDLYIVRVQTDILADDFEPEEISETKIVEFAYPKTTWQMFKHCNADKWFMRWLVSKRPILLRIERRSVTFHAEINRRDIYPHARYQKELGQSYRKITIDKRITDEPA
jgi:hypothetical protein